MGRAGATERRAYPQGATETAGSLRPAEINTERAATRARAATEPFGTREPLVPNSESCHTNNRRRSLSL